MSKNTVLVDQLQEKKVNKTKKRAGCGCSKKRRRYQKRKAAANQN